MAGYFLATDWLRSDTVTVFRKKAGAGTGAQWKPGGSRMFRLVRWVDC
jgi:hypothetical protein